MWPCYSPLPDILAAPAPASAAHHSSRACQQKDWNSGHKQVCKKLRKQRVAEAKLAAAGNASSSAAATAISGDVAAGGSQAERPEESNGTLPVPARVLYPPQRYAALAAAPPTRSKPLGLQNVGNSCYANSLLQSLLATPALAAYLVSGAWAGGLAAVQAVQHAPAGCRATACVCGRLLAARALPTPAGEHSAGCPKPSPSEWCALCELERLAQQAYRAGASGTLNPRPLVRPAPAAPPPPPGGWRVGPAGRGCPRSMLPCTPLLPPPAAAQRQAPWKAVQFWAAGGQPRAVLAPGGGD